MSTPKESSQLPCDNVLELVERDKRAELHRFDEETGEVVVPVGLSVYGTMQEFFELLNRRMASTGETQIFFSFKRE